MGPGRELAQWPGYGVSSWCCWVNQLVSKREGERWVIPHLPRINAGRKCWKLASGL